MNSKLKLTLSEAIFPIEPFGWDLLLLCCQILIILIVANSDATYQAQFAGYSSLSSIGDQYVGQCNTSMPLDGSLFAVYGAYVIICTYFSFRGRKLPTLYNESSSIFTLSIFTCCYSLIIIPLVFGLSEPVSVATIMSSGILVFIAVTWATLYSPKLYVIYMGKANEASENNAETDAKLAIQVHRVTLAGPPKNMGQIPSTHDSSTSGEGHANGNGNNGDSNGHSHDNVDSNGARASSPTPKAQPLPHFGYSYGVRLLCSGPMNLAPPALTAVSS